MRVDELIQLAIDAGEAGVHFRLEARVTELRVLPLFDESCDHRRRQFAHRRRQTINSGSQLPDRRRQAVDSRGQLPDRRR